MLVIAAAVTLALLQEVDDTARLARDEVAEPCRTMRVHDRLEFDFSASGPLDFNVHYHADDGVNFPIDMKSVDREAGVYIAPFEQTYCLMWTNKGSGAVELQYHYRVLRPGD